MADWMPRRRVGSGSGERQNAKAAGDASTYGGRPYTAKAARGQCRTPLHTQSK